MTRFLFTLGIGLALIGIYTMDWRHGAAGALLMVAGMVAWIVEETS